MDQKFGFHFEQLWNASQYKPCDPSVMSPAPTPYCSIRLDLEGFPFILALMKRVYDQHRHKRRFSHPFRSKALRTALGIAKKIVIADKKMSNAGQR